MHRLIPAAAVVAAAACALAMAPRTAGAQACADSNLEIEIQLPTGPGTFAPPESVEESKDFFNLANCTCGTEFAAALHLPAPADQSFDEPADIWVGTDCDEASELIVRQTNCELVHTYDNVVDDLRAEVKLPINSKRLMWPNEELCQPMEKSRQVHILVDDDNANDTTFLCKYEKEVSIDTDPPVTPDGTSVNGGESSLVIQWDRPATGAEDIDSYQFFCARAEGEPPGEDGFGGTRNFTTAEEVCGGSDAITSGLPGRLPASLLSLDKAAICGAADGSETQIRIEGLTNDVEYEVVMVTIDEARNGSAVSIGTGIPQPVRDFWEDYKDKGGGAEGGVCLINSTYGPDHPISHALRDFRDGELARAPLGAELTALYYTVAAPSAELVESHPALRAFAQVALLPLVGVALLWQQIGLGGMLGLVALGWLWRRRHRAPRLRPRLVAATAAAALLALAAAPALAQDSYDPYWEAWDDDGLAGPAVALWNLELKVGPYLPAIDDEGFELTGNEGAPFEETFRGKGLLMFGVELQRFFWFPAGQLGATASMGFMGRSTNAYQVNDLGGVIRDADGNALRAPGNKTRFRLIPMSLGAVYRFAVLDDRFGVPLVPYAKAGLSYYLWWIRQPDGSFARAQKDPTCMPSATVSCETTRGLGASIGVQGSIGLSLRAERIDTNAAANLRNEMGIEHAGFFVELLYAKVDHFGASDRLAVGDFTWLAGINFEF